MALANIDLAVTGRDSARGFRGRYRSANGAVRVMGKLGLLGLARQVARRNKWHKIPADLAALRRAGDGDRGIARTVHGPACVIRYRGVWVGRHHGGGNIMASDGEIAAAWSIV